MTPIELITEALELSEDISVDEVLIPEQCLLIYANGKSYHVTIQEMTNED